MANRSRSAARRSMRSASRRLAGGGWSRWGRRRHGFWRRSLVAVSLNGACLRHPEASVNAFSYLAHYYRNQQLLRQVPSPFWDRSEPDVEGARLVIEGALADGRKVLSTSESKALLTAFRIPTMPSVDVRSANEALVAAQSLGYPVAMKINSPSITHKSDVGGVRLNVDNAQAVRTAYNEMIASVARCSKRGDPRRHDRKDAAQSTAASSWSECFATRCSVPR